MKSPLEMIRNSSLREEALTHRSFTQELKLNMPDNERLEFLGDALLDMWIAEFLMRRYLQDPEGVLSKKRASLVNEEVLAAKAVRLGLDKEMKLGPAEARSGGAGKASLLSDVFEAVLAALYMDRGFEVAKHWLEEVFEKDLAQAQNQEFEKDYKTRFQEWAQSHLKKTPRYVLLQETGPAHQKHFHVEVRIDEEIWGEGHGLSKKKAEQQAAEQALAHHGALNKVSEHGEGAGIAAFMDGKSTATTSVGTSAASATEASAAKDRNEAVSAKSEQNTPIKASNLFTYRRS